MNRMAMLVGLLVAIMSINALGVGFIGPPTAEMDQAQWNVGFNYTYISTDLASTKIAGSKVDLNDNNVQRYYGSIGYGLTDMWEAYVQLGIADVKLNTDSGGSEAGFNFDNDFAWGWGTRYTFYEQDKYRWGVSVQMNWLDTSWDSSGGSVDYSDFDLLVGVGPTVDMGSWKLYGGPFYYMIDGDLDIKTAGVKVSGDLEEDSNIGGFIGAQCTAMDNYDVTAEFSFTSDGWAIGAGITVPF